MNEHRISAYADALITIARAEQDPGVESELISVARAIEGNQQLRDQLSNPHLAVADRQGAIETALSGRFSPVTTALVSMVVGTGRAAELPAIAEAFSARSAGGRGEVVAVVRSAVALSSDQLSALSERLAAQQGQAVSVRNVVDPSVVGGLLVQVGDEVIDGTVRSRLAQLREVV